MIYKIILKNFKSNLRNYLLFFSSEVLAVAMIVAIFYIRDILMLGSLEGIDGIYLSDSLKLAIIFIAVINVFLMFSSVKYYLKTRLKDYGLFLTLGMKQKMVRVSLSLEFGTGCIGALIIGTALGYGIGISFRSIITRLYTKTTLPLGISVRSYLYALISIIVIMVIAVFVIFMVIEERGMYSFTAGNDRKEIQLGGRCQVYLTLAGFGGFLVSIALFGSDSYNGINSSGVVTLAGCIVSLFLILTFGGSIVLKSLKKRQKPYYKNLLSLNQFYHRYNSNLAIIFMLFAIQIISLGDLAVQVADNMPVTPNEAWYPYDYVWLARQENEEYAMELVKKYGGEETVVPATRITNQWGAEHFGISQNTYERMTGETIDLTGNETVLVVQGRIQDVAGAEQSNRQKKDQPGIHIGKRTEKMVIALSRDAGDYFNKDYDIKDIRRESIFGYLGDGWRDNVYVFSNDFFKDKWDRITKDSNEPDRLIMLNIAKEKQSAFSKELNKYIKKYGIPNESFRGLGKTLYESSLIKAQKKAENVLQITINLFLMFLLYIGSVFIMGMKMFSDLELFRRKYEFLNCMGMRRTQLKKAIGKEMMSVFNLPIILSYISCIIFMIRFFAVRRMNIAEIAGFIQYYGIIVAVYFLMQIFSALCMKRYLIRKVEEAL